MRTAFHIMDEYLQVLDEELDLKPGARVTFNGLLDWIEHHTDRDPNYKALEGTQGTFIGVSVEIEPFSDGDAESGPCAPNVCATMIVLTDDGQWISTDPKELVEYAEVAEALY